MEEIGGQSARKVRGKNPLTPRATQEAVRAKLTEVLGERRSAAKVLANAANANERAAENWLSGLTGMSLTAFINAVRAIPELKPWAIQLLEAEAALDPRFPQEMDNLLKAYAKARGWTP